MSAFSNAIETTIVNHAIRATVWAKASTHTANQIFFACYEVAPGEDGTGGTEAAYTSYARIAINQTDAEWTYSVIATGVRISNTNDITLVTPTGTSADLLAFGICPSSIASPTMIGSFDAAVEATSGQAIVLPAGSIKFDLTQDNLDLTDYLAEQIMKHIFWADTWSQAANLFGGIYTTMPVKAGTGGVLYSGNNYADIALGPSATIWDAPVDGVSALTSAIDFPNPTADWIGCVGQGIHDGTAALLIREFTAGSTTFPNGATVSMPVTTQVFFE